MNIDPVPTPATVAALWVLALGSFGVLGWRACQVVSALRRARPESRWDALPVRLGHFLEHVLLQPRLFNERTIGWAHFLIFWGFLLYAFCFSWALLRGLFPFLPVPYPDEVRVVGLGLELFAVGVLIALVAALARRLFYPPPRLHLSLDANLILGLIALLMVTTLLGSAGRCVAEGGPHEETRSVGRLLAPLIPLSTPAAAADVVRAMWWLHMVGVFFFIGYLPYSKHAHLLVAPLNVFFTNLRPVGDLTVVGAPDEGANGAAS